jgi:thiamine-phosphate diphosphorylase
LEAALQRGIRLVEFRQPGLAPEPARRRLDDAMALCRQYDARLLVNSSTSMAERLPGHGLHANAATLMSLCERPVGPEELFSASCHNAAELACAERLGADLVLLSPVKQTATHPLAEPLGWEGFRHLASGCSLPVYALGGMTAGDLARARAAGAHGVAGIGDFWRQPAGE